VYDAEEQLADSVAVYLDGGTATGGQASTIVDITGDTPHVVRLGALTLAQLRAVVPEVTTDLEDDKPDDEKPTEAEKPVEDDKLIEDEKLTEDKPVDDEKLTDEKPIEAERHIEAEKPVEDEKATDDKPVLDEKPAEAAEPTEAAVPASKSEEKDEKPTEPDVRPAD
jgi:L-threonylcarbamoyladenylate synthase